jgi:hypothetical protein
MSGGGAAAQRTACYDSRVTVNARLSRWPVNVYIASMAGISGRTVKIAADGASTRTGCGSTARVSDLQRETEIGVQPPSSEGDRPFRLQRQSHDSRLRVDGRSHEARGQLRQENRLISFGGTKLAFCIVPVFILFIQAFSRSKWPMIAW